MSGVTSVSSFVPRWYLRPDLLHRRSAFSRRRGAGAQSHRTTRSRLQTTNRSLWRRQVVRYRCNRLDQRGVTGSKQQKGESDTHLTGGFSTVVSGRVVVRIFVPSKFAVSQRCKHRSGAGNKVAHVSARFQRVRLSFSRFSCFKN